MEYMFNEKPFWDEIGTCGNTVPLLVIDHDTENYELAMIPEDDTVAIVDNTFVMPPHNVTIQIKIVAGMKTISFCSLNDWDDDLEVKKTNQTVVALDNFEELIYMDENFEENVTDPSNFNCTDDMTLYIK